MKKYRRGKIRGKHPEKDMEKALKPLRFKAFPLVEVTGIEPVSESALTETSPGAEGHLHSLILPQAFML